VLILAQPFVISTFVESITELMEKRYRTSVEPDPLGRR